MGTIYRTKDSDIITQNIEVTIKGKRHVLDISDEKNIKAYPLSELTTLGESFDVICKYHPNYEHCDEAAWLDDLDCIIDGECDMEKTERITSQWGSDPDVWQRERDGLYSELLAVAIAYYCKLNNIKQWNKM